MRPVDLTTDDSLSVSIVDALNEQDAVKFTVQTKVRMQVKLALITYSDHLGSLPKERLSSYSPTRGVCVAP